MVSLRMQIIQRLEKQPEKTTSKNFIAKILENQNFTPILSKRLLSPKRAKPHSKEPTPLKPFSIFRLHSTSSREFYQRREQKSDSISLELTSALHPIKRINKTVYKIQAPRVKKKVETGEYKVSSKSDIDKLWKRVFNSSCGYENVIGRNYKVFIGKGNNSCLIRRVMAARIWWKIVENKEEADFVWTQWKDLDVISSLKSAEKKVELRDDQRLMPWPVVGKNYWPKSKISEPEFYGLNLIQKSWSYRLVTGGDNDKEYRLYNKLEFNQCLSDKKGLFLTMQKYYKAIGENLFERVPLTFLVTSQEDPNFEEFLKAFQDDSKKHLNIWIIKPGENSNRGNGIEVVSSLSRILEIIKPEESKSFVLQKYIENPFLINKRKFDIRCYAMLTSTNGVVQAFFYQDGYLRTASNEFSTENTSNAFIHLTNDAIQKYSPEYSKYENGNKLSYKDFQRYLDLYHQDLNFSAQVLPKIKQIIKDTILASYKEIDQNHRLNCFEILGYDFMIDKDFKPWLIEVNTNPCLELSSITLRIVIPGLIENAFKLVVDSLFPPPGVQHQDQILVNKFELIFSEISDGARLESKLSKLSN